MNTTTLTGADQAENRARLSKTVAYFITFVALGLAGVTLGPTLQGLSAHVAVSLSAISILFPARSLGYMLGSFVAGRFYDRVSGHPVVIVALLVMAAALVLVPLAPLLWLLVLTLFVLGVAEGAVDVGGNTLLLWVHGRKVGPFMNGLHFCWGLGAFFSPIIIAQAVLATGNITLAYWLIALLMLPPVLFLLRLPSPQREAASADRPTASANLRLAVCILLFFLTYVGAEAAFGGWVFSYAVALGQIDKTGAAYLTSVFWGGLMLGRLLSVAIAHYREPHVILAGDLIGCLACLIALVLLPRSVIAIWLGTFGVGLFMASMFPTMLSFAEMRMAMTGQLTGWFLIASAAGGMSVPWLVGQLFEPVGPRVTVVICLIVMLMCAGAYVAALLTSARFAPRREVSPDVTLGA